MCKAPAQLVLLNSRDRVAGTIASATYSVAVCQTSVVQMRLENFVILNGFLAVTAANNVFTVTETVAGADTFAIPPGTYDTAQFTAEIASLLAGSGVLANAYTVAISPTTLALTITASGGALDTFALSWGSASYVMGFGSSAAPTAPALTVSSPFAVQLGNVNKLLIRVDTNQGGQMVWATNNATANFVVDIDVNFGSYFSYRPPVETFNVALFPQPVIPRRIRVDLIDAATGALVDPRGSEYQLELAFWPPCASG